MQGQLDPAFVNIEELQAGLVQVQKYARQKRRSRYNDSRAIVKSRWAQAVT